MQQRQPIIEFNDVSLSYGDREVFHDASFRVHSGHFYFLTGVSGSGKTSLLKLIYCGLRQTTGNIKIFGRDTLFLKPDDRALIRRRIGIVFQDFRLIPHLTVYENVALPLQMTDQFGDHDRENIAELLNWVGLSPHVNDYPNTLSGGQQQRVAIARAVITRPTILLADEPTGNMDDGLGLHLMYLFEELNRIGTTVIVATHNASLLEEFKYPVFYLSDNRIHVVRDEKPEEQEVTIKQDASHLSARRF